MFFTCRVQYKMDAAKSPYILYKVVEWVNHDIIIHTKKEIQVIVIQGEVDTVKTVGEIPHDQQYKHTIIC